MKLLILALIILVGYVATLICSPDNISLQFMHFKFFVSFTTKDKSENA